MLRLLHDEPTLADQFLIHMLARNTRIEEDLIDQLFNSSEKRLARALLLLAHYGTDSEQLVLPRVSQETLAKIVGTTRSRVNFFMNKFRELGFLEYNGAITVHRSLLTVVLND
jgi:CRP-like cAMP-binding protein